MLRSFIARHHRSVFFVVLYLVYLGVLFGFVGVRDTGHSTRILARLAIPAVELGMFGMLCAACMRLACHRRGWPWLVLAVAIAALAVIAYLAQVYALYLSNNFISVLALQNSDSAAFVQSPLLKASVVVATTWLGLFCMAMLVANRSGPETPRGMSERWSAARFGATLFALGLLFFYSALLQDKNQRLEPGFRQAPIVNLMANFYRAEFEPEPDEAISTVADEPGIKCFDYGSDPATSEYPFQRTRAYSNPLPFARLPGTGEKPNVVVIFTEGASARMVGAYGGHYPGLTPNIDQLASKSMRVDDYFNHTAATFRGLSGQLSSGFSYAGGGGKEGWTHAGNQAGLGAISRQTLPRIVNDAGYDSYFFAPHKTQSPLVMMLRTLGFEKVYARESIATDLLHGHATARPGTGALDDQSLFRGVVAFLEQRSRAGDDKPFFVATYNIGTHAFLEASDNDIAYGDSSNRVLDKLHNYDSALGRFLRYFYASPYADNTILVFTSDHSTYPEAPFRDVAGPDLKPYFVDRIPMLIMDPIHRLPSSFDAKGRNSLDLAPTVLQLAGLQTQANSFMGRSIFEPRNFPVGVAALGSTYFMTTPDGVFGQGEIPPSLRATFDCEVNVVRRFYQAERDNRIFQARGSGAEARQAAKFH